MAVPVLCISLYTMGIIYYSAFKLIWEKWNWIEMVLDNLEEYLNKSFHLPKFKKLKDRRGFGAEKCLC